MNIDIEKIKSNIKDLKIDSLFIEENSILYKVIDKGESLHELRSIAKVILTMCVGIAISKKLLSLNDSVYELLKNYVKIKSENVPIIKKWRIKDLLLCTTGYDKMLLTSNSLKELDEDNLLEYVLNYDLSKTKTYVYNNVEAFIISVIFKEHLHIDIADFANKYIFEKLDIKKYKWEKFGKYTKGCTGLYLRQADFHKIGVLLINDGFYNNESIVPSSWINEMLKLHLYVPNYYKKERVFPKIGTGYYLYISRDGFIFKEGTYGQYLIINKKRKLIISLLANEKDAPIVTEILRGVL